ncbi:MAG: hypothetical protein ACTSPY_08785 [Candidatus Helarchaeota archaeon]
MDDKSQIENFSFQYLRALLAFNMYIEFFPKKFVITKFSYKSKTLKNSHLKNKSNINSNKKININTSIISNLSPNPNPDIDIDLNNNITSSHFYSLSSPQTVDFKSLFHYQTQLKTAVHELLESIMNLIFHLPLEFIVKFCCLNILNCSGCNIFLENSSSNMKFDNAISCPLKKLFNSPIKNGLFNFHAPFPMSRPIIINDQIFPSNISQTTKFDEIQDSDEFYNDLNFFTLINEFTNQLDIDSSTTSTSTLPNYSDNSFFKFDNIDSFFSLSSSNKIDYSFFPQKFAILDSFGIYFSAHYGFFDFLPLLPFFLYTLVDSINNIIFHYNTSDNSKLYPSLSNKISPNELSLDILTSNIEKFNASFYQLIYTYCESSIKKILEFHPTSLKIKINYSIRPKNLFGTKYKKSNWKPIESMNINDIIFIHLFPQRVFQHILYSQNSIMNNISDYNIPHLNNTITNLSNHMHSIKEYDPLCNIEKSLKSHPKIIELLIKGTLPIPPDFILPLLDHKVHSILLSQTDFHSILSNLKPLSNINLNTPSTHSHQFTLLDLIPYLIPNPHTQIQFLLNNFLSHRLSSLGLLEKIKHFCKKNNSNYSTLFSFSFKFLNNSTTISSTSSNPLPRIKLFQILSPHNTWKILIQIPYSIKNDKLSDLMDLIGIYPKSNYFTSIFFMKKTYCKLY